MTIACKHLREFVNVPAHFPKSYYDIDDEVYGWRSEDRLYCRSVTLYKALMKSTEAAGEKIVMTKAELWKRFHDAGIAQEPKAKSTHIPGAPGGRNEQMIVLDFGKVCERADA